MVGRRLLGRRRRRASRKGEDELQHHRVAVVDGGFTTDGRQLIWVRNGDESSGLEVGN